MREQEMRMRVFRFLKARMRNMIMPATVGIGLAVGGCAQENATPIYSAPLQDSGPPAQTDVRLSADGPPSAPDTAGSEPDSRPLGEDAAPDSVEAPVIADAGRDRRSSDVIGRDAAVDGSDVAPPRDLAAPDATLVDAPPRPDLAVAIDGSGIDTGADLGGTIVKYSAQVPDAAAERPVIVPLYTAVMPDAGAGADGLAVRYMATMPDAAPDLGWAVPDYMAPHQS